MKQTPGPATLNHFRDWANRLAQMNAVLDPKPFFETVAYTKIRQFSAEALAYEISDMRGIKNDSKRYTLLLSLLHQTQLKTRDELVDMFLRRMKRVQHTARDNLRNLQEKNREMEEELINFCSQVARSGISMTVGRDVARCLEMANDIERIGDHCMNLVLLAERRRAKKYSFSEEAKKEIEDLIESDARSRRRIQ